MGSIKKIVSKYNPFAICRRKGMRKRIVNSTPSLLTPNCLGGILFHDLGLQFRSPTVNTMILQRDFAKFVLNLDHYLAQELVFFKHPKVEVPCAKLDDITIHFTHYKTEQEAQEKWLSRMKRLDRDNLFIILAERDGLTPEEITQLGQVKARGLVVLTANAYPELPYALQIRKYKNDGEVGNILSAVHWNDGREYEKYFDFVKWFNEADGGDYDVRKFARRGVSRYVPPVK